MPASHGALPAHRSAKSYELSPMVVHALIFTPRHTGRPFATKERSQKVGGAVQKTYGDLKENVKDELKKQRQAVT